MSPTASDIQIRLMNRVEHLGARHGLSDVSVKHRRGLIVALKFTKQELCGCLGDRYLCIYIYIYIYMCTYINIYIDISMYIYIYIHTYIDTYVYYINIYIHIVYTM